MKRVVLFGGGNQVHYTIDILNKVTETYHEFAYHKIVGIIDSVHEIGSERFGYKVIGRQEDLKRLIDEYQIDAGLITIGDNWTRHLVHESIIAQVPDFEFINAIHPSVIIGENVKIGKGIIAMAGCIFNPKSEIGDFTFFATGAQIEHDCKIKEFASVSAGSVMGGYVTLGAFSAVTLGVVIVDRVEIGEHTVIGSGSLVLKSIGDNLLVHGHPINSKRARKKEEKFLK